MHFREYNATHQFLPGRPEVGLHGALHVVGDGHLEVLEDVLVGVALVGVGLARGGVAVLDRELEGGRHGADPLGHVLGSGDHGVRSPLKLQ